MRHLRSTGIFAVACPVICFIIAIERYVSKVTTAKAIADQIEGFEFESVATPIETMVAGLAGVVLLIIGLRLTFESLRKPEKDGLI